VGGDGNMKDDERRGNATTACRDVGFDSAGATYLPWGVPRGTRLLGGRYEAQVVEAELAARLQHVEDVAILDELVALDRRSRGPAYAGDLIELRLHLALPTTLGPS